LRVHLVYCHPCPESFAAALCERVLAGLGRAGHEVDLLDLYASGFDPVMGAEERRRYHDPGVNEAPVAEHLDRLRRAEALVLVYPTWWYGPPALLKGWLDRVWVPHATFTLPEPGRPIGRVLTNIRLIAAVSTLGSPWWWWTFLGQPGRRQVLTGLKVICHPRCRTLWLALHRMDTVSEARRRAFLAAVEARFARL
jgi:putative NADPH-quinone reductase